MKEEEGWKSWRHQERMKEEEEEEKHRSQLRTNEDEEKGVAVSSWE